MYRVRALWEGQQREGRRVGSAAEALARRRRARLATTWDDFAAALWPARDASDEFRLSRVRRLAAQGRWHTVALRRGGGGPRPLEGRLLVAIAPVHAGINTCVHMRLLSCTVCHSMLRAAAIPGDLVVLVSSVRPRAPPAYCHAVAGLPPGGRVVLAAFTVESTQPVGAYYLASGRPDAWYRRASPGEAAWVDADGVRWARRTRIHGPPRYHTWGGPDLRGASLGSRHFVRFPSSLAGAPALPPGLHQAVSAWGGRGVLVVTDAASRRWCAGL